MDSIRKYENGLNSVKLLPCRSYISHINHLFITALKDSQLITKINAIAVTNQRFIADFGNQRTILNAI